MAKLIKITLRRSTIGSTVKQIANVEGLGLTRRASTVYRVDTPEVRGMIQKVLHLVDIEKADKIPAPEKKISYVEVVKATTKKAAPKKTPAKKAAVKEAK